MKSLVRLTLFLMMLIAIQLSNSIESSADAYKFRKENIRAIIMIAHVQHGSRAMPGKGASVAKCREIRFYVIAELTFQHF